VTEPDPTDDRPLPPPVDVPPVSAEELVDGEAVEEPTEQERRYPSTIGGAFYLLVLVVTMVGLGVVAVGEWRTGVRLMASGLVLGSLMRLVLPARDAGMLAVRHKALDAALLVALAGALLFLASSIPDQPGV
jgi:hypothetical protein